MDTIPKLAILALVLGACVGCEETVDPVQPATQQSGEPANPLDVTPQSGNSALGGAIRAAERTEDKMNDYQERLNRQMDGEEP